MSRFFLGLLFGTVLTAEAFAFAGAGHGSYAPLFFVASVAALSPLLAIVAGPLLWAIYFLFIPNLETARKQTVTLLAVSLLHVIPGSWLAFEDPAFARSDSALRLIFGISVLATFGFLLFLCRRTRRVTS